MTLLIVDDEYYNVEILRMKAGKKFPEFDKIFCAYNIEQALDIFSSNEISIMICDIEMPGGSGLELLEHIRRSGWDTICIFLTAYSKFEYISRAMKLSSIDYLLKPVDDIQLFAAVRKAQDQLQERQNAKLNTIHASYWKESEIYLIEMFWSYLLTGIIENTRHAVTSDLKYRRLSSTLINTSYLLILVQCVLTEQTEINKNLYDFTIKNILREYFYCMEELPIVVRLDHQYYILPLPIVRRTKQQVMKKCKDALREFAPYFPNAFNFYIAAEDACMPELPFLYSDMKKAAVENVSLENQVFDLSEPLQMNGYVDMPFYTDRWTDLLLQRNFEFLKSEIVHYLSKLQHAGNITRESLVVFYYSFLQMLLSNMERNYSEVLPLFKEQISQYLVEQVCSSLLFTCRWVDEILCLYSECLLAVQNHNTAVSAVKQYIHTHLDETLGREDLAALVFLNPDYLSHIFKRETGLSLTNYIINERIQEAKRLLSQKDKSIRDIALTCGFQNISYFSKQFKKATGKTPREFRN